MNKPMFGICEECNRPNTIDYWCHRCNAKRFRQNFKNWTSYNDDIDKFIQDTQISADCYFRVLEWIPYDRFRDVKYVAKGGFGNVYKAIWSDGYIRKWDNKSKNWYRYEKNKIVALKSLNNSKNVTLEFINEITLHHKVDTNVNIIGLYGITQDPETKNYMMVLDYAESGSLRNYLDVNYDEANWKDKILYLYNIADGLNTIHKEGLTHQDLHIGNILKFVHRARITDMGLSKPADYNNALKNTKNNIYGVLPYIAPEILRGQNYAKPADIYSFGIIMYEIFSGLPPYFDVSHDKNLAIKICQGLRPRFSIKIPQLIVNLIKKCLDANPLNRPTSEKIEKILCQWNSEFYNQKELQKQIEDADEINKNLPSLPSTSLGLSYEIHPEAIYTSRLFSFNNLPEPRNL